MDARGRAKQDELDGDLGLARKRLMSLMATSTYDPKLCREIAELSVRMGDLTEAGRWYLMTAEQSTAEQEVLIERYLNQHRRDKQSIINTLPTAFKRLDIETMPDRVRIRLKNIGIRKLGVGRKKQKSPVEGSYSQIGPASCLAIAIVLIIALFVGFAEMVSWFL